MSKCIILSVSKKYTDESLPLLKSLVLIQPDLICFVGADCKNWEDEMDWVFIENVAIKSEVMIHTTSHPDESLEDVISFAKEWCFLRDLPQEIKVIYV